MTVNVDVPSPRCQKVIASQTLRVVNNTGEDVDIHIAGFGATITPGGEQEIGVPFGSYLAPGVHSVSISSLAGGAEIWLVAAR